MEEITFRNISSGHEEIIDTNRFDKNQIATAIEYINLSMEQIDPVLIALGNSEYYFKCETWGKNLDCGIFHHSMPDLIMRYIVGIDDCQELWETFCIEAWKNKFINEEGVLKITAYNGKKPQEPWCVAVLHYPQLRKIPEVARWLGDFTRIIAIAWLSMNSKSL